jgi:hypothetical protein
MKPGLAPAPPKVWIVVVSRHPPPPGAEQVGDLAFLSSISDLPKALSKIRASAHKLGGSLVAPLRCRPESQYQKTRRFDFASSERLAHDEWLQCYATVWRVP